MWMKDIQDLQHMPENRWYDRNETGQGLKWNEHGREHAKCAIDHRGYEQESDIEKK